MSLKAIIFDLDDTLIEDANATERSFKTVCHYAHIQYDLDPTRLHLVAYQHAKSLWNVSNSFSYCHAIGISATEGLWGSFEGKDPELQILRRWVPIYQREVWYRALLEQGIDDKDIAEQLAALFRDTRSTCYAVFPEVEASLRELGRTHKLAMLTNGASDLQRAKIQRSNLASYFETIVVSGEAGVGKPEPEVFMEVLNKLAVQPDETAMVGDSLPRDIFGAYRTGLKGIWINRLGRDCDEQYSGMVQARIETLRDLQSIV